MLAAAPVGDHAVCRGVAERTDRLLLLLQRLELELLLCLQLRFALQLRLRLVLLSHLAPLVLVQLLALLRAQPHQAALAPLGDDALGRLARARLEV